MNSRLLNAAKAAHRKAWRVYANTPEQKIMLVMLKAFNRMGRITDKTPERLALQAASAAVRAAKKRVRK